MVITRDSATLWSKAAGEGECGRAGGWGGIGRYKMAKIEKQIDSYVLPARSAFLSCEPTADGLESPLSGHSHCPEAAAPIVKIWWEADIGHRADRWQSVPM
ncbi:hypothetical protein FHS96_003433 [Sphingomonas zeicaulis]|uniref:hypothetical protein n=1 Tax=Sphingomonas zeicaulis TaxID=1632740 RepID=UPI003D1D4F24